MAELTAYKARSSTCLSRENSASAGRFCKRLRTINGAVANLPALEASTTFAFASDLYRSLRAIEGTMTDLTAGEARTSTFTSTFDYAFCRSLPYVCIVDLANLSEVVLELLPCNASRHAAHQHFGDIIRVQRDGQELPHHSTVTKLLNCAACYVLGEEADLANFVDVAGGPWGVALPNEARVARAFETFSRRQESKLHRTTCWRD